MMVKKRPAPVFRDPPAIASRGGASLLVAICLSGCHDSPTDPLAALTTAETAPALAVEIELPSLVDLAARTATEDRLVRPLREWTASLESPDAEGSAERAIADAAPVLAEALGTGGVIAVLAPLHQALRSLESLSDVPARLEPGLEAVRSAGAASRNALAEGREADALRDGLVASDRLRALGPEAVARALVARADAALDRTRGRAVAGDGGSAAPADAGLRRGADLLQRARRAIEAGDFNLAVQRAFYASQLLEGAARR